MSGMRSITLVALLSICIAPWVPDSAEADERWLIEIQRYLYAPDQCPSPHDKSVYKNPSFNTDIRNSTVSVPNESAAFSANTYEITCLQGTRLVRRYGFHHIEVVHCDHDEYYVYEALRGRLPWRIMMSAIDGEVIRAEPLN